MCHDACFMSQSCSCGVLIVLYEQQQFDESSKTHPNIQVFHVDNQCNDWERKRRNRSACLLLVTIFLRNVLWYICLFHLKGNRKLLCGQILVISELVESSGERADFQGNITVGLVQLTVSLQFGHIGFILITVYNCCSSFLYARISILCHLRQLIKRVKRDIFTIFTNWMNHPGCFISELRWYAGIKHILEMHIICWLVNGMTSHPYVQQQQMWLKGKLAF